MIKVKTFVMNSGNQLHHERLDNAINNFITENEVEIIDIKYSTSISNNYCLISAMLIYKTPNTETTTSAKEEKRPTYAEECRESMRRLFEMNDNIDKINEEIAQKLLEAEYKNR